MLGALTSSNDPQLNSHDNLQATASPRTDSVGNMFQPTSDTSTLSPASVALASMWLKTCLEEHTICNSSQKTSCLPTRVINVSNPDRPFLELGHGRKLNYVTLSYKWGTSNEYMTTQLNEAHHFREISLKQLPKTLQDAINVTCWLGFSYLWIDALCIVQDDPGDKQREISHMGDIYSQSILTLCAKGADDAAAGLAVQRDPRCIKPCQLNVKATVQSETFCVSTFVTVFLSEMGGCPLDKRGWALQEQVLAVRSLNFHPWEMRWRCKCAFVGEGCLESRPLLSGAFDFESWKTMYQNSDDYGLLRFWMEYRDPTPYDRSGTYEGVFACWYRFIQCYSFRSLSYLNDVLPAIAGIATTLSSRHYIHYINGLWEEDLPFGLLWTIDVGNHDFPPPEPARLSALAESYHFPSWTWMSQWGKDIKFKPMSPGSSRQIEYTVRQLRSPQALSTPVSNIVPSRRQVKPRVSFQQVTTTALSLEGFIMEGIVDVEDRRMEHGKVMTRNEKGIWTRFVLGANSQRAIGYIVLDSDPDQTRIHEITCCLCEIRRSDEYGWLLLVSLGMVATGRPGEYERVGLFYEEFDGPPRLANADDLWDYLPLHRRRSRQREVITLV